MVPGFWGRHDYLNVGMGGGSVNPNPYFAPDFICSFCTYDRKQAVNQNCLWALPLATVDPSFFPLPGLGMNTQSQGFPFPASGDDTHRLSRAVAHLHYHTSLELLGTPGSLVGPGSGLLGQHVSFCF